MGGGEINWYIKLVSNILLNPNNLIQLQSEQFELQKRCSFFLFTFSGTALGLLICFEVVKQLAFISMLIETESTRQRLPAANHVLPSPNHFTAALNLQHEETLEGNGRLLRIAALMQGYHRTSFKSLSLKELF